VSPLPGGAPTTMTTLIRRHPVASYFLLAIIVSWGGILAIVLPGPIPAPASDAERQFPAVYLAMLAGPTLAALAVIAFVDGRAGFRELGKRLLAWRADARWYAAALLVAPVAVAMTAALLSRFSDVFIPAILAGRTDTAGPMRASSLLTFVTTGVAIGAGAGFFEELGWTGVAVPRMLRRHGILWTGVGAGLVWGAWHFLAIWWGSADAFGSIPVPLYLVVTLFAFLPPYRVLMAWVYRNTQSLLIGVLMHASLTTSMVVLGPAVSGADLLVYDLVFGLGLWIIAAVVVGIPLRGSVRAWRPV
jgi:membrane protease YdiL (CAAX protease family)